MERVQKILSNAGYCSRRAAEDLIAQGKVTVNGKKISLGDQAGPKDKIVVEGKELKRESPVYLIFNKPTGCVTALTDARFRTIMHYIDCKERVFPVGRLDMNTSGLLLLTNDGTFANTIMHPRYEIKKTYVAEIDAPIGPRNIAKLEAGIKLTDGKTEPAQVKRIHPEKIEITIHEGKNRVVRRMLEALGYNVVSLERTRIGFLDLHKLKIKPGKYKRLHEPPVVFDETSAPLAPPPHVVEQKRKEKAKQELPSQLKQKTDERVYVEGFAYSGHRSLPAKKGSRELTGKPPRERDTRGRRDSGRNDSRRSSSRGAPRKSSGKNFSGEKRSFDSDSRERKPYARSSAPARSSVPRSSNKNFAGSKRSFTRSESGRSRSSSRDVSQRTSAPRSSDTSEKPYRKPSFDKPREGAGRRVPPARTAGGQKRLRKIQPRGGRGPKGPIVNKTLSDMRREKGERVSKSAKSRDSGRSRSAPKKRAPRRDYSKEPVGKKK